MNVTSKILIFFAVFFTFAHANGQAFSIDEENKQTQSSFPKTIEKKGVWRGGDTVLVQFLDSISRNYRVLPPALQNLQKVKLHDNGILKMTGYDYKNRFMECKGGRIVGTQIQPMSALGARALFNVRVIAPPDAEKFDLQVYHADTLQTTMNVKIRPKIRWGFKYKGQEVLMNPSGIENVYGGDLQSLIESAKDGCFQVVVVDSKDQKLKVNRTYLRRFDSMANQAPQAPESGRDTLNTHEMKLFQLRGKRSIYIVIYFEDTKGVEWFFAEEFVIIE